MSSVFVSGGTDDEPVKRSDEWLAAQQELDANRQRKAIEARQNSGKSLFEVLEANKAAKQEAFEEANKIKNQFRSLDADEVDFLDSVLESTRAEENRVKRETAEGLEGFRKQQEEADKKARAGGSGNDAIDERSASLEDVQWQVIGAKRKRVKEKEFLKGLKVMKPSAVEINADPPSGDAITSAGDERPSSSVKPSSEVTSIASPGTKSPESPKAGLGLANYSSDEGDD